MVMDMDTWKDDNGERGEDFSITGEIQSNVRMVEHQYVNHGA